MSSFHPRSCPPTSRDVLNGNKICRHHQDWDLHMSRGIARKPDHCFHGFTRNDWVSDILPVAQAKGAAAKYRLFYTGMSLRQANLTRSRNRPVATRRHLDVIHRGKKGNCRCRWTTVAQTCRNCLISPLQSRWCLQIPRRIRCVCRWGDCGLCPKKRAIRLAGAEEPLSRKIG